MVAVRLHAVAEVPFISTSLRLGLAVVVGAIRPSDFPIWKDLRRVQLAKRHREAIINVAADLALASELHGRQIDALVREART